MDRRLYPKPDMLSVGIGQVPRLKNTGQYQVHDMVFDHIEQQVKNWVAIYRHPTKRSHNKQGRPIRGRYQGVVLQQPN